MVKEASLSYLVTQLQIDHYQKATSYAFYAFYAWWFHFPQSGALRLCPHPPKKKTFSLKTWLLARFFEGFSGAAAVKLSLNTAPHKTGSRDYVPGVVSRAFSPLAPVCGVTHTRANMCIFVCILRYLCMILVFGLIKVNKKIAFC
jgi:hypothetical protein